MRQWLHEHPTVRIILIVLVLVAPGYLRQEQAIDRSERAIVRAEEAIVRTEEAIELIMVQREEARFNTCLGDRVFALAHNGLVQYLADSAGPDTAREVIDAYLAANLVPVRECTAEAIKKFYENGPGVTPPAVQRVPPTPATAATNAARRSVRSTTTSPATSTTGSTTSTTFHSSPGPTDPACEVLPGATIPQELPCL